jgi:NADH:ubiquinone oxidoreductase subunit 4 (subunit M)
VSGMINSLPPWASAIAYGLLVLGVFFTVGFVIDYRVHTAHVDEIGRHMAAMTLNLAAFFLLYLVLAVWPEFPGRDAIRFVLFVAIIANCGWRWYLYRKTRKEFLMEGGAE